MLVIVLLSEIVYMLRPNENIFAVHYPMLKCDFYDFRDAELMREKQKKKEEDAGQASAAVKS